MQECEYVDNIIQIHNIVMWNDQMWGIFCGILSIPQNIVMNLNNVINGSKLVQKFIK